MERIQHLKDELMLKLYLIKTLLFQFQIKPSPLIIISLNITFDPIEENIEEGDINEYHLNNKVVKKHSVAINKNNEYKFLRYIVL